MYKRRTLRTALNEAVRGRLIESNPWYKLEMTEKIKIPESKRDFLIIEGIKKMTATPFFNEQVRQVYLFSCSCGLRTSDIRKLCWRDISISGGQWLVSIVMTETTNPVYIPLSSQAVKWLPECDGCTPDGLVFGGLPNTSNLYVSLKNWADKAGIKRDVTFHAAHHSCAALLLTLGTDIYTVSKILGHRFVHTTQVYVKIVDKKKDDAIALVDDAFQIHHYIWQQQRNRPSSRDR